MPSDDQMTAAVSGTAAPAAPLAPPTAPPKHDPYADLPAAYAEEIEYDGPIDYGASAEPDARHTPKTPTDNMNHDEDLPLVGKWFGFHIDGDPRYE